MSVIWIGFGSIAAACILLIMLGMEVQTSAAICRIEEKIDQLNKQQ